MPDAKYSRYYTYIKPVIQNPIVRSYVPYIFSLITITIFALFAIKPTVITILSLQKNLENNQKVLVALESKAQSLSEGKQNLDNLDQQVKAKIGVALPNQANVTTLIASLQIAAGQMASSSALQIQPLTIYDGTAKSGLTTMSVSEVEFTYNLQGPYPQLLQTLQNIRKSPRLIKISSISMSRQSDNAVMMSVSGNAYFLK